MLRALLLLTAAAALGSSCTSPADCGSVQCLRAVQCRASCTSPVTSSGCCPCPVGTFDDLGVCLPDGGTADGGR